MFLGLICFQKRSYKSQLLLWFHHNHLRLKNIYGKIFQSSLHQPCCSLDNPSRAGSCTCTVPDSTKAGCLADQTEMPAWTGCSLLPAALMPLAHPQHLPNNLLLPPRCHRKPRQPGAKLPLTCPACLHPTCMRQCPDAIPTKMLHSLIQPGS